MNKLILALILLCLPGVAFAQEYQSNTWASWASVAAGPQTSWVLPYRSRTVTVINGSATPVCVAFGNVTILSGCVSSVTNQVATGDNKVFQLGSAQWITLNDMVTGQINLKSAGSTASPVSVLVNY